MKIGFQGIAGYAYGLIQPSAVLVFDVKQPHNPTLEAAFSRFTKHLNLTHSDTEAFEIEPESEPDITAMTFVCIIDHLNAHCGDQRFSRIKVMRQNHNILFIIPTLSSAFVLSNLESFLKFMKSSAQPLDSSIIDDFYKTQKRTGRRFLPSGTNSGNFISAAAEQRIPFKIFSFNHLILGYGSGSLILNSTISERESAIGVPLAKSKVLTNKLLRLSGFPVPDQARVGNVDETVRYASKFGYPVVLKPEDEAQGRGIHANIQDEVELRRCFEEISKDYRDIILEKHISGDHYRIDFMGDQLIKAVRRRPASIVGDGKSTVRDLVEKLNSDPIRSDINSSFKPIIFDKDVQTTLSKQSLSLESTPARGLRVVLRSISNLSRGGEQEDFRSSLHAENYKLCLSAAKTMRLDVAGVDLISEDASKPWYENNAAICEVNAQPQLGESRTRIYREFLSRYPLAYPPIRIVVCNKSDQAHVPIFNKTLDEIEIRLAPEDVFENGCPTQYFTSLDIADDVPDGDRKKLARMLVSVAPRIESCAPLP